MKIKFITWNIWYGKFWKKAIKLVKKLQPDILALQEITTFFPHFGLENVSVLEEFQKAIPVLKHSCFAPVLKRRKEGKIQQLGNAVLSRHRIIDKDVSYFHTIPHWGRRWWNNQAKNLLEAKIKIGEKQLFVYSTHLTFVPFLLDTRERLKEAENITKIVEKKRPLIMGGDFNGKPKSKVIKKLKRVLNCVDPQNRPTFTKFSFSAGRFKVKGLKYKLDYVFYSKDLKIKSCQILDTNASDHLPIVVEFEI